MSNESGTHKSIRDIETRIDFLDKENQRYRFGLDVLRALNESIVFTKDVESRQALITNANTFLNQLLHWSDLIYLEINTISNEFELSFQSSSTEEKAQQLVNDLIESGAIAWAVNQTKPMLDETIRDDAYVCLQNLSTPAGIFGMFIGTIDKTEYNKPSDIDLNFVGMMLNTIAATLKNFEYTQANVEKRKELQQQLSVNSEALEFELKYDRDTGLINRNTLVESINAVTTKNQVGALLLLTIDHYTQLRDSLGHNAANVIISKLVKRIKAVIKQAENNEKKSILFARLDNEKMALFTPDTDRIADAISWVEQIRSCCESPISVEGENINVTTSIGIALYPQDSDNAESLIENTQLALTEASYRGINSYRFYSNKLNVRADKRIKLINSLHSALENDEFLLHYQPQHQLMSRRCIGFESFIRWQRSEGDLVPPAHFLPYLEENDDLMYDVGLWVLQESLSALALAKEHHFPARKMAINLSARQLRQRKLAQDVSDMISKYNLPPKWIELELTETALMQNISKSLSTLNELHEIGVQIAIDDFGTGYSSLSYLKRMPISAIKIDRSFIKGLPFDTDDIAIVRTIIDLAKNLRLKTVAEGIEFQKQSILLRELGCDIGQGFLYSKPHPFEHFLNK